MASSQREETAAAAEQLGSMSLGKSVERKDNDTEATGKNGTKTESCSACGKESDTLKKCTACKCIWYCNVACQMRHRSEHREKCNRIKKELDAAAEPLNESAKRKVEPGNNEDANKDETPTKVCSACGEKSDTLKKCNGCLCVWYCDKDCQNKHRKEHKIECRRIKKELDKRGGKLDVGTEKDLGPLPDPPPKEDCPICMRPLSIHTALRAYFPCCGKTLCCGCDYQHAKRGQELRSCAFCREPISRSDEVDREVRILAKLRKRAEGNDRTAMRTLGGFYSRGQLGLPLDQAKCIDLYRQSADLGCPDAQFRLGGFLARGEMGLEQNEEEANKYWKKAAEGGHLESRHNLGCTEVRNGGRERATGLFAANAAAMRHWRLSASGGYRRSMESLIVSFEGGLLHHGDLAGTLQAMYRSRAEMRSENRDEWIKYLKKTGQYQQEYDL